MKELLRIFKALADETRIRIIKMLQHRSLCVCEITEALGINQSSVSHHLKILEEAGLIEHKRDGQWINYELSEEKKNDYILEILNLLKVWINNEPKIKRDIKISRVLDRKTICKK